jgi:hypothetical protein
MRCVVVLASDVSQHVSLQDQRLDMGSDIRMICKLPCSLNGIFGAVKSDLICEVTNAHRSELSGDTS